MLYYNSKGQVVGEMRDGIYVKRVKRDKHFMHIFQGYGISKEIIDMIAKECKEIRINEDGDRLYRIKFPDFMEKSIEKTFEDTQLFVPLSAFEVKDLHQQSFL